MSGDDDLIFYNNPSTAFISYKDVPGTAAGGRKQFIVALDRIPAHIQKIAFTLTLYDGENRRQSFGQMSEAECRIMDQTNGAPLLRCNLGNQFSVETAVVVGELYRYGEEWKFNAIVAGFSGGLKALCGNYGIEVEDEPAPAPAPVPKPPERTPLQVPPRTEPSSRPNIVIPPRPGLRRGRSRPRHRHPHRLRQRISI